MATNSANNIQMCIIWAWETDLVFWTWEDFFCVQVKEKEKFTLV